MTSHYIFIPCGSPLEKVILVVSFPPLCPAAPTTWCDPHHDLRPPCGSTHQRPAVQLQRLPTPTRLPHPWGSHQPQRSAAAAGGGWRAGGGGRRGHREHRYRADSRGQQRHREQEAELRRARRDIQQRAGQRGASCCQSGVWGSTHDLLRPNRGIVGYWVRGFTENECVSRGSCHSVRDDMLITQWSWIGRVDEVVCLYSLNLNGKPHYYVIYCTYRRKACFFMNVEKHYKELMNRIRE